MPELPEVQTTVEGLRKRALNRTITDVWCDWPKMLKDPLDQRKIRHNQSRVAIFRLSIQGAKILNIERRAKNIIFTLSKDRMMLIHQKMSGHLLIGRWKVDGGRVVPLAPSVMKTDPWNGYIHFLLTLNSGEMIALSDLRKFAKVVLGTRNQILNLPELVNLGPEPLNRFFTARALMERIYGEKRAIKTALMDPTVISGIGNIYSDEMLWAAKIHPLRRAGSLTETEARRLYAAMRDILRTAVRLRGTSAGDYRTPDGVPGKYARERLAYQRNGEPCKRCGVKIRRIKLGGRSVHFCPQCQRRGRIRLG